MSDTERVNEVSVENYDEEVYADLFRREDAIILPYTEGQISRTIKTSISGRHILVLNLIRE